jgi:hypothetical protein
MKPERVEYRLAADRYNRSSRLIGEAQTNGTMLWSIVSDPVSQRDEGEHIRSLTTEQLVQIGEIAKNTKRPLP